MKKIFYTLAIFAIALASCSKEQGPSEKEDDSKSKTTSPDTFICSVEGVKTSLKERTKVCWEEGDAINVNGSRYVLAGGAGKTEATFEKADEIKIESPFYAFFPYGKCVWDDTKKEFNYTIPNNSNEYSAEDFSFSPMFAHTADDKNPTLKFENITSMLKVNVPAGTGRKLIVRAGEPTAGKGISGAVSVGVENNATKIDFTGAGTEITINLNNNTTGNPEDVYAVLPAVSNATFEFEFEYRSDTDIWTKKLSSAKTLVKNTIYKTDITTGENAHHGVKIGDVYWADRNIGATNIEDFGWYFSWGNVMGFEYKNSKWSQVSGEKKPLTDGFTEGNYKLTSGNLEGPGYTLTDNVPTNTTYDAARSNWGCSWRLPTITEFDDLDIDATRVYSTTECNVKNGNTVLISFPSAGIGDGALSNTSRGYYWSRTSLGYSMGYADAFLFDSTGQVKDGILAKSKNKYYGLSIRPVHD